jgi:hypothetical protein
MYNPSSFKASQFDDQEYEYIELTNTSTNAIDLGGMRISGGIDFIFPFGTPEKIGLSTTNNFDGNGTQYSASTLGSGAGVQVLSGGPSGS